MGETGCWDPGTRIQGELMKSYRELKVWQGGRELVKMVYLATQSFPREERFGLTQQVRRAAVSVPSNIAEGHGRGSTKDYLRFLAISMGSVAEAETQLILANDLGLLAEAELGTLLQKLDDIGKMLRGLRKSLKSRLPSSQLQAPSS